MSFGLAGCYSLSATTYSYLGPIPPSSATTTSSIPSIPASLVGAASLFTQQGSNPPLGTSSDGGITCGLVIDGSQYQEGDSIYFNILSNKNANLVSSAATVSWNGATYTSGSNVANPSLISSLLGWTPNENFTQSVAVGGNNLGVYALYYTLTDAQGNTCQTNSVNFSVIGASEFSTVAPPKLDCLLTLQPNATQFQVGDTLSWNVQGQLDPEVTYTDSFKPEPLASASYFFLRNGTLVPLVSVTAQGNTVSYTLTQEDIGNSSLFYVVSDSSGNTCMTNSAEWTVSPPATSPSALNTIQSGLYTDGTASLQAWNGSLSFSAQPCYGPSITSYPSVVAVDVLGNFSFSGSYTAGGPAGTVVPVGGGVAQPVCTIDYQVSGHALGNGSVVVNLIGTPENSGCTSTAQTINHYLLHNSIPDGITPIACPATAGG